MLTTLLERTIDTSFALIPRFKPSSASTQAAALIAHRGAHDASLNIKENTMEAFRLAKQLGCWGIELDVQTTADQVLVVNHDATLKRLWNSNLVIAQVPFSDLRTQVPEIPTLTEVIKEFGTHIHLFIELKKMPNEDLLMQALQDLHPGKDYHLLTLDVLNFQALSQFPKQALLLVALYNNIKQFCELSLKEEYGGVLGHYLLLTSKLTKQLRNQKQRIGVGFVNSKYSLYRELNRDIDWLFTNQAIKVSACLRSLLP
jgi:glycerophosphoryl diester phosphodiesterase